MTGDKPPVGPQAGLAGLPWGLELEAYQNIQQAREIQRGSHLIQEQLGYNSTDDDYIPDLEQWDHREISHQDIYNNVQNMMPGVMHSTAKKWGEISAGLGGAVFGLNLSIQKAISENLKGEFADTALAAARKFVDQTTDVQEVIRVVGLRIETAAYGAEAVKRSVPPPPADDPAAPTGSLISVLTSLGAESPEATTGAERAKENAYQNAILAMNTNYNPTYQPAGQGVPTFVPVDSPGDGGPGPNAPGWSPGTGGPNSSTGTDGKATGTDGQTATGEQQAQTDPASTTTAGDSSSSAAGQGNQAANSGQQGAGTTSTSGSPTTAAGFGGGTAGRGGSGSSGGFGGGGSGRAGGVAGGPGRSTAGVPGAGNPAAAAAQGAGKAGTPGMGMPGMGGGAAGRKGEDDEKERKTPDYLVMDREEELLGRRERTVPQAIGADIPAAQTQPDNGGGHRG